MERYSSRGIDELSRIVLPGDVRAKLGLDTEGEVSFALIGTLVIMQCADKDTTANKAVSKVNELGMVELPKDIRQVLGWNEKDKVALYLTDEMVIIKSSA